jgi:predicted Rossmann fold nucleotide-binding protein DprA/Smf involved in DNA uptake
VLGLEPPGRDGAEPAGERTGLAGEILGILDAGPAHVDQLARTTGAAPGELQEELLRLELAGSVIHRPGGIYARV